MCLINGHAVTGCPQANARVTIFGDVYQLPVEMQESAREVCALLASTHLPM